MVEITFTGESLNDVANQARDFAISVLGKPARKAPETQTEAPPADVPDRTKTKELALEKLRTVYGKPDGADAVKKALAKFKVKKAADVPVEKAAELLTAAEEAETSLAAE